MQLITLKIDDSKYHFVDFEGNENPQQQYIFNNNVAEKRIIKFAPFDNYNIREGVTFQTNIEKSRCYISEIELSEGAATENVEADPYRPCIKILLSAERPKDRTIINKGDNNRLRLEDNGQLSLRTNRNRSTIISIEVVYKEESHKFTLIYANEEKIADAVLDYGSEASQLLVCSRDRAIRLSHILNLFSEIKDRNINGDQFNDVEDDHIAQYSENNRKLFLSKFMVKKSIEEQFLDDVHREVKLGDFLKFIFKKGDIDALQDDYTILPNMKIMNSGIDDIEINIKEHPQDNGVNTGLQELGEDLCHRMSINVFIFQALEQVRQNNIGRTENRVEYVSFSVLMPNNYSYVDISKRLKYLRIDIQQILDVFHEKFDFIKGFEVSAVSESDASLIGAYETSPERIDEDYRFENGRYLILDAGKGTFDFSIMEYTRGVSLQNLCKSGIIGAGNAISYAILLDIIDGIIVKDDDIATHHRNIEAFIGNIILGNSGDGKGNEGGDPSRLLELMNAIDLYKKGGRRDKHNLTTRIATDGLYINGLINIINDEFITPERSLARHRFTDIMIEKIVNSIFSQIDKVNVYRDNNGDNKIDYYVCAGRGFLYQPLKDAIVRKIEERFPECREVGYIEDNNNVTPKNVCLFISNAINNGRYNSNVIGTPFIINDLIIENNDKKDASKQKPKRGFLSQLGQQFMQLVSKEEAIDMSATLMPTYQTYMFNGEEKQVDAMVTGYNFNNKNNTVSRINIGGVEFTIAGIIPQNSNIDVFYNGEKYIIRSNGRIYGINRGVNIEGQLGFESLFPSVKRYPNNYTSFFNANDFDMEEDDVIESIAMPTPQIPDSGENQSATKSKPEPIVTDTPQSPKPSVDKGGSDDSKNTPFDMESLLGDIDEENNQLK